MGVAWIRRLVLYLVGPARTTCEICGVNDATDVNPDGGAGGICDACMAIHFIAMPPPISICTRPERMNCHASGRRSRRSGQSRRRSRNTRRFRNKGDPIDVDLVSAYALQSLDEPTTWLVVVINRQLDRSLAERWLPRCR